MSEIKLPEEYGETYEACVVPGEYEIDAIGYDNVGVTFRPRQFQPIRFSLKPDDSVYMGDPCRRVRP